MAECRLHVQETRLIWAVDNVDFGILPRNIIAIVLGCIQLNKTKHIHR